MWLKLIRLPVSYFDKQSSGETVSRVINDTSIVLFNFESLSTMITGIISIIGPLSFYLSWIGK